MMTTTEMTTRSHHLSLTESAQDYALVARAIRYIENHRQEQPELAQIAGQVGLSDFHFQRLFSRWAGVSPKRFLQALTVEEARRTLARSGSLLDAAYDSGLSGPGRLHDLFVQCQAATPGEVKSGGAGLTIRYAFQPTPFGLALIGVTDRGICGLSFVAEGGENRAHEELRARWPNARFVEDTAEGAAVAQRIFDRSRGMNPCIFTSKARTFKCRSGRRFCGCQRAG